MGCAGLGDARDQRSDELALGGGDDGSLTAGVTTGTVGSDGGREGASGADVGIRDAVNGAAGGAIPGVAGDAGGRQRARGANTP